MIVYVRVLCKLWFIFKGPEMLSTVVVSETITTDPALLRFIVLCFAF